MNYTGDDIDTKLLQSLTSMPQNSVKFLTFRAMEANDTDHPLNKNVWVIFILRYGNYYGLFEARTYNSNNIYRANYQNQVLQEWQKL